MTLPFVQNDYAVISIDGNQKVVRGILASFAPKSKKIVIRRRTEKSFETDSVPGEVLKQAILELNVPSECNVSIMAVLPSSSVFECELPKLKPAEMRQAIEFEIPANLIKLPEHYLFQYSILPAPDDALVRKVIVHVFARADVERYIDMFAEAGSLLDNFIHPLLALPELSAGEEARLPELPENFCWQDGEINFSKQELTGANRAIMRFLGGAVEGEFSKKEISMLLSVSRLAEKKPLLVPSLLNWEILPDNLKIRRYRNAAKMAVVFGALFLIGLLGIGGRNIAVFRSEYVDVKEKNLALQEKMKTMQRTIERKDKEVKEMNRVLGQGGGEHKLLQKLAVLTDKMPGELLVNSLRWNENTLDLNMVTDQNNADIASAVKTMRNWKITRQQQRQMGELTSITLQLTAIAEDGQ